MEVHEKTIDVLVRRIVEEVHPIRIILFGSAARGNVEQDSDIDLLVVMPEGVQESVAGTFSSYLGRTKGSGPNILQPIIDS